MPGVLLWGWDDTNKVWVKLQVDANGLVKVDMSAINLNDLGDVSVAAPADDDLFYYDDATGLWKSRKLEDADIPAAIARDAEVTADIATHAALPDVHHAKQHALDSAPDHTGNITDAQHGVRALANAHAHSNLSGIGANDHHTEFTTTEHDTADRHPLANLDPLVCSEAEADSKVSDHAALTTGVHGLGSKCRVHRASAQAIATGTWTKVQFNVVDFDTLSEYDAITNYRFIATNAGYYFIAAIITLANVGTDVVVKAAIQQNGAGLATGQFHSAFTNFLGAPVSGVFYLNAADYIEGWVYHEAGASRNLSQYATTVMLSIYKLP